VRHGRIGLTIAGSAGAASAAAPRDTTNAAATANAGSADVPLRLPVGTSVLEVTAALRAVEAQPQEVAAILLALRQVGALPVEVIIR
jgi:flagellar basal body P-ring protein FlgI